MSPISLELLKWPRKRDAEEKLLQFVRPAPATQEEKAILTAGLVKLISDCYCDSNNLKSMMETLIGRKSLMDKAQKIRKAAKLLNETGLDFDETIDDLNSKADNLETFIPTPEKESVRTARVIERCRAFLLSHGKHAGLKDTDGKQGMAIQLAQAVIELCTRGYGKPGVRVHLPTLASLAKRKLKGRGKPGTNTDEKCPA